MSKTSQWNMSNQAYKKLHGTTTTLINITDLIYETCDENAISMAIATDQSSAFDCVIHELLLRKLRLYNFDESAIKWIRSYLSFRSQYVEIGGKESMIVSTPHGVPQGSILGPTMYILYINEMGEIPNDYQNCINQSHRQNEKLFNSDCKNCGTIFGYADDSTYFCTSKSRETNLENITKNLDKIKEFLDANKLNINPSKTALIEIMLHQKQSKIKGNPHN